MSRNKKKPVIDGKPLNIAEFNTYYYGEPDPDMPLFRKSEYQIQMPKLKNVSLGRMILSGTTEDDRNNFKELWTNKND